MNKIKLCVIALVFGLAGIVYASTPAPSTFQEKSAQAAKAAKAECCAADKEHQSCGTRKDGEDCCQAGASCCDGGSCCARHANAKQTDSKQAEHSHPAMPAKQAKQAENEAGCCSGSSCCSGGACCAKHKARG